MASDQATFGNLSNETTIQTWPNITMQLTNQTWPNKTIQLTNQTWDRTFWDTQHPNDDPLGEYDLVDLLLLTTCFVIITASTLGNTVILEALSRVPAEALRPKTVLINTVVANLLFSNANGVVMLGEVLLLFLRQNSCLISLRVMLIPITHYGHAFAYLFLSLDRLYSIIAPFRYRMWTSSKFGTVAVLLTWSVPVFITVPGYLDAWMVPDPLGYCHRLSTGLMRSLLVMRVPLVTALKIVAFFVYIFLFLYIKCSENFVRNCKNTTHRNDAVSLAVTFFVIHLISLVFFVMAPLYNLFNPSYNPVVSGLKVTPIHRLYLWLNLLNPVLDPIITGTKIPAIKMQIIKIWRRRDTERTFDNVTSITS